jgi:hypothetical protein
MPILNKSLARLGRYSLAVFLASASVLWATRKGPDAAGYTATDATVYSFTEIAGGGGSSSILANSDDNVALLTLPFPFQFYGQSYTMVCASSNGLIWFVTSAPACVENGTFANTDLTTAGPPGNPPAIMPYWMDLTFGVPGAGSVYYQTQGSVGSRKFILEWSNAYPQATGLSPNPVTFQLILYETSNQILFQYKTVNLGSANPAAQGAQSTVGIRDASGNTNNRETQWSYNAAVLNDSSAILFAPAGGVTSTTTSLASSPNPSAYGQAVTLTATVSPSSATGTVTFHDGPATLGTGTLSKGVATLVVSTLAAGSHSLTAVYGGDSGDPGSSGSVTQTMNPVTPTITWSAPAAITYGTALSATQLNATASVPGAFVYAPPAGTVLSAGSRALSATFTPTDTTDYTTATASVTITVNQAILNVTVNSATRPYGTANPTLTAAVTGFVNGDPASVVSGSPALATTATPASLPGTYPITVGLGTLAAANYSFNLVGGTLTVAFTASAPSSGGSCNGAYNGTFNGNLTVSAGQNCIFMNGGVTGNVQQNGANVTLIQSQVDGNVQVNGGSTFIIGPSTTIKGNLQIQSVPTGSGQNQVCGSTVNGDLQFQSSGTAAEIGAASPASCAGNKIGGNLTVQSNSAAITVVGNTVSGNLMVQSNSAATIVTGNTVKGNLQDQSNTGPTQVYNNTVGGNLQCQSNTSITGGGNTAKSKQGQCAAF